MSTCNVTVRGENKRGTQGIEGAEGNRERTARGQG
jgi:hypothetical protein